MTHKTKECLSRPRKQGAKWTGRDIQADEMVEDVKLGWDAKRDRWNGYDPREYSAVVKEYEELENLKRAQNGDQKDITDGAEGTSTTDDAHYAEETDMGRSQPTSTRQLRLREDTAKYLLNLDLDSAKYDPKTRSMDTTSQSLSAPTDDLASEGFQRPIADASDATAFEAAQRYAWETQESSLPSTQKLHLQANPTEGEVLRKKQQTESAQKREARQKALQEKYGMQPPPTSLNPVKELKSSETYHEYDESGRIKGLAHTVPWSKYAEDIHTNNHTSVWGSWWSDFTWGYACCHSTVKNSYCTGEEGKAAFAESDGLRTASNLLVDKADEAEQQHLQQEQNGDDVQERKDEANADTLMPAEEKNLKGPKKRTLQEIQSGITEEELEMYKRNRMASDDPMSKMLGRDELLN